MKLKVLKTWVSKDYTIIFQTSPLGRREDNLPKKVHLLLDLRQQSFGLRITEEKPTSATANHAFIQILRKHLSQFTLKDILKSDEGDIFLPLLGGAPNEIGAFWTIKLSATRPPLASLIDPQGIIHVSFGQKGTFTKKQKLAEAIGWEKTSSIFESVLSDIKPRHHEAKEEDLGAPSLGPISEEQRELSSRLKRKLKTTKKNLEKLRSELPDDKATKDARLIAQHLQQYAYLVKADAHELRLDGFQSATGQPMAIELDPDLSTGQNIEAAFQKARKVERKLAMGLEQIHLFERYEKDLSEDIERLRAEPQSKAFWSHLVDKYKLPELSPKGSGATTPQVAKPYKTYLSSTGHTILVGKGSKENDILTKSARANDYWFHAVGVTGSHVIVPCTSDLRQALPAQLMKEAAVLALNSSRTKDDQAGECYVTRRSSLKKQKNMPAGLWKVEQSETIFIRYSVEELQKILASIKA